MNSLTTEIASTSDLFPEVSPKTTFMTRDDFIGDQSSFQSDNATSSITDESFCKAILYEEIYDSRVRIWDLAIIIPNLLFLLFMIVRFNRARLKLRATNSPIFSTFYGLVALNALVSVIRCVVAMTVNAALPLGDVTDKVLWVVVRFFLLATEISVLIFGIAFGHLDSHTSIRRILFVTGWVSLLYSGLQGALEITAPDENFYIIQKKKGLFSHGGMLFWFVSSVVFSSVYLIVLILPWTKLRERLALPSKQSFYWYVLFLDILNIAQSVGSGLLYYHEDSGLCIVDATSYIYFAAFTPLVYRTFLADFFSVSQPSIMFSYKAQVDDVVEDDNVSLPHQLSCSSLKTDSDYIYQSFTSTIPNRQLLTALRLDLDLLLKTTRHQYTILDDCLMHRSQQNNSLYDSTHFDAANINPLYIHSLQSPDSFNGFEAAPSITGSINSNPPTHQQQQQYQQGLPPTTTAPAKYTSPSRGN